MASSGEDERWRLRDMLSNSKSNSIMVPNWGGRFSQDYTGSSMPVSRLGTGVGGVLLKFRGSKASVEVYRLSFTDM